MKNQKYYVNILVIFLFFLSLTNIYAKNNKPEDYSPYVKVGEYKIESGYFETKNDGQLYITKTSDISTYSTDLHNKKEDFEIRMKQNTIVSVSKNPLALTDELELQKGTIGLKVASDTLLVKTKFADIRLRNSIVTLIVTDNLVRLCVLKGTAIFIKKSNFISVDAGNEIAASKDKISKTYKFLDDLRYVWYWKSPTEEPSLKK